eukprot:scaffold192246_cov30-Tisochrysis_lutea.AAC.1
MSSAKKVPKNPETLLIVVETAKLHSYEKIHFRGKRVPKTHGKKGEAMDNIRAALNTDPLFQVCSLLCVMLSPSLPSPQKSPPPCSQNRVPTAQTLDHWIDEAVEKRITEAWPGFSFEHTGDGDDPETHVPAVAADDPLTMHLDLYIVDGILACRDGKRSEESTRRDEDIARDLEEEMMNGGTTSAGSQYNRAGRKRKQVRRASHADADEDEDFDTCFGEPLDVDNEDAASIASKLSTS